MLLPAFEDEHDKMHRSPVHLIVHLPASGPIEYQQSSINGTGEGRYHKMPSGAAYVRLSEKQVEGDGYGNGYYNRYSNGPKGHTNYRMKYWYTFDSSISMLCAVTLALDKSSRAP